MNSHFSNPANKSLSFSAVMPSLPLTIRWLRDCVKENPSLRLQVRMPCLSSFECYFYVLILMTRDRFLWMKLRNAYCEKNPIYKLDDKWHLMLDKKILEHEDNYLIISEEFAILHFSRCYFSRNRLF